MFFVRYIVDAVGLGSMIKPLTTELLSGEANTISTNTLVVMTDNDPIEQRLPLLEMGLSRQCFSFFIISRLLLVLLFVIMLFIVTICSFVFLFSYYY